MSRNATSLAHLCSRGSTHSTVTPKNRQGQLLQDTKNRYDINAAAGCELWYNRLFAHRAELHEPSTKKAASKNTRTLTSAMMGGGQGMGKTY